VNKPFVLVVEDNRELQALLVEILQFAGMSAQAVGRGDDALRDIVLRSPALVLLDVDLPGTLSGIDVLSKIRSEETLKATKVILLTAQHAATRSPEAEAADLVLLKPVDADQLIGLAQRLIGTGVG
jgi:two-component system, OmpR family, phosphate regulon response regulator PhoB